MMNSPRGATIPTVSCVSSGVFVAAFRKACADEFALEKGRSRFQVQATTIDHQALDRAGANILRAPARHAQPLRARMRGHRPQPRKVCAGSAAPTQVRLMQSARRRTRCFPYN